MKYKGVAMKKPNVWKQNKTMKMIGEHKTNNFAEDPEITEVIKAFTSLPGNGSVTLWPRS